MTRASPASVRDAEERDISGIQDVARASWAETYAGIYTSEFIGEFLSRAYSAESLERSIEGARSSAGSHFLVAERGGEVVGYLHFGAGPQGAELHRLYARPDQFGTGIGHALLTELEARLDEAIDRYVLYVHERNERGRRFYARQGFAEIGRREGSDEEVMLEKRLLRVRPRGSPRRAGRNP